MSFTARSVSTNVHEARVLVTLSASLAILCVALSKLWRARSKLPLPPGPRRLPIVGNILDLPTPHIPEAQHWAKHRDLYGQCRRCLWKILSQRRSGPISSVTVLGKTIIIINDMKVAFELLDRRSQSYSDRPTLVFVGEM